ncbi:unnamed protein product [Rotaria magnacalcarata]|uniref:Vomeronasal type-1 receptor n=1 Tax=Rotaria magnacalcarata TaxID=392030 RepID=A0A817ASG9_9BILA|nr:unnamed protein product [Rotaria magnacalcarata]
MAIRVNRYRSLIVFIFVSVGAVLNVIIFSTDRNLKQNPCSRFFLASVVGSCIALFSGLPTRFSSSFGLDLTVKYDIPCKFYMITLLGSLSFSVLSIALVSIERWLASCIKSRTLLLCSNQTSTRGAYSEINSLCLYLGDLIHLTLYNIAPTRSMLIFGLLSLRNIQQHRRRIANVTIGQIDRNARRSQRQQSTLTILTLIQVCSITMCNSPADTHKSYSSLTEYMYKSP